MKNCFIFPIEFSVLEKTLRKGRVTFVSIVRTQAKISLRSMKHALPLGFAYLEELLNLLMGQLQLHQQLCQKQKLT